MAHSQGTGLSRRMVEELAQSLGYKLLPGMLDDIVAHLNSLLRELEAVPQELIKPDTEPSFAMASPR